MMRAITPLLLMSFALGLSACQSLDVGLPGKGSDARPAATAAPAQAASSNGLAGAALCASAAYYLADQGAMDEAAANAIGDVWMRILEVIPADSADARQKALDDAYAAFSTMEARGESLGLEMAIATIDSTGCPEPDFQRQYLARWGDPDLMEARMQDSE